MTTLKVIHGSIWYGNKLYADATQQPEIVRARGYAGDSIEFDESDEEQAEQMRELLRLKVAARPEDLLTPTQAQDLVSENAALRASEDELKRQLAEALARIDADKSIQ